MNSTLKSLYEYNRYYNERFIQCLTEQDHPEQCRQLLSHICNTHHIWLRRAQSQAIALELWQTHSLSQQAKLNEELHRETFQLLEKIPAESLDQPIFYQNNKGRSYVNRLSDMLYHLINHSTHHRAQIALLLRQNGIEPPGSDYIFYQRGDHIG